MIEERVKRQLEADGFVVEMLKPERDGVVLYDPKDGHPFYVPGAACSEHYLASKMRAGYTMSPPSKPVPVSQDANQPQSNDPTQEKPKTTYRKKSKQRR